MDRLKVLHFSDLLCVWAFVSQVRIDELQREFGEEIEIESRFVSVFGDIPGKLEKGWAHRGGRQGYAEHVQKVVGRFEHVSVDAKAWADVTPISSLPCHIFLCGVRRLENDQVVEPGTYNRACWALRCAFFLEARDISSAEQQWRIASELGIDEAPLRRVFESGEAHAEFSCDLNRVQEFDVTVSPTILLNEARQRLTGNVGYRVMKANVSELLRAHDRDEASWC